MLQLKEFLKTLNWKEYEAAAYCTIVEGGPMKANDLAVKSGIPPGRVYEVVTTLMNKSWLKKIGSRPAIYDAQNPRLVLEVELEKMQKKMAESLKDAEQLWELRTGRIGDTNDKSWTVSGAHGATIEVRNILGRVKRSVNIADTQIDWLNGTDMNRLGELAQKGVSVVAVSTAQCIDQLKRLANSGIQCWVTDRQDLSFYIIDEELVLMKLTNPDGGSVVRDSNVGKLFVSKFQLMVKNSKKVKGDSVAG